MESELEFIEKLGSCDNRLVFFAGIVKAHTELDIETIFKFLSSIYDGQVSEENIKKIEGFLIDGKLGKVKELLVGNKCNMCTVIEGEKIKIACGHFFHVGCLVSDLINKIDSLKKYLCVVCNEHIPDIEKFNVKVKSGLEDYKLAYYYEKHSNKYPCPKCNSPCEGEKMSFAYCSICSLAFCTFCFKISDSCTCNSKSKNKSLRLPKN